MKYWRGRRRERNICAWTNSFIYFACLFWPCFLYEHGYVTSFSNIYKGYIKTTTIIRLFSFLFFVIQRYILFMPFWEMHDSNLLCCNCNFRGKREWPNSTINKTVSLFRCHLGSGDKIHQLVSVLPFFFFFCILTYSAWYVLYKF